MLYIERPTKGNSMSHHGVPYSAAVCLAADLVSEHGENPEYDRGVTELLAELYATYGMFMSTRCEEITADIKEIHNENH